MTEMSNLFSNVSQPKKRLAEQIYDQILKAIRKGKITKSDRLVQEKLAEQFGVSRTPLREALLRLEQEGILRADRKGSFRLYHMTREDTRQLYQLRAAIESQAARILAKNLSKGMCDALRETITKAEDLPEQTVRAYFDANQLIHRKIVIASKNKYLLEAFDSVWSRGSSYTLFSTIPVEYLEQSLGDHLSLIDAIETGDATVATERMIDHIFDGFNLQIKALEARESKDGNG